MLICISPAHAVLAVLAHERDCLTLVQVFNQQILVFDASLLADRALEVDFCTLNLMVVPFFVSELLSAILALKADFVELVYQDSIDLSRTLQKT